MQILNTRKIRILIIVLLTAFAATATLSIIRACAKGKSKIQNSESPVLQPAPDNLMSHKRTLRMLQHGNATFYVDDENDIIINKNGSKAFKIDKQGNITSLGSDGEEFSYLTEDDRSFLEAALEEIRENYLPYSTQAESAKSSLSQIQADTICGMTDAPADSNESETAQSESMPHPTKAANTKKNQAETDAADQTAETDSPSLRTNLKRISITVKRDKGKDNKDSAQTHHVPSQQDSEYISLDTDLLAESLGRNEYAKQNSQDEKRKFLDEFAKSGNGSYILTQNDVAPGTIVPITLITGINSDLPGEVIAQTNTNIYDTLTGEKLLIAKGSKLIATYDSRITYGQQRILIAWTTLVRSDGLVLALPGFQGTDNMGRSGYSGSIDNHFAQIAGASLLSSLIDLAGLGLSELLSNKTADVVLETLADSVTSPAMELMQKSVNRQPTITMPPGTICRMLISGKITLPEQKT